MTMGETDPVTPTVLRSVVGRFGSGVTVVTTLDSDGNPAGCTVSAFSSLSLDPALVLVCIDTRRPMHANLAGGPGFVINILAAGQEDVAYRFAMPSADKFAGVAHRLGRHRIPLISGAIAHLECDLHQIHEGGDHSIVLGLVKSARTIPGDPLLYSEGKFLDVGHRAWERAHVTAPPEWLLSAAW